MQYWPHRRAQKRLPRMRSAPRIDAPVICNIVAFKAGMTHFTMLDDTESVTKGAEISKSCTILEIPETNLYGIRFYGKDPLTNYKVVAAEISAESKQGKSEDAINKMRPRLCLPAPSYRRLKSPCRWRAWPADGAAPSVHCQPPHRGTIATSPTKCGCQSPTTGNPCARG